MFEKTAKLKDGRSEIVVPWLNGFVNSMGQERVQYLLRDAGIVQPKQQRQ